MEIDPCTGGTANICRYCKGGLVDQSNQTKNSKIVMSVKDDNSDE